MSLLIAVPLIIAAVIVVYSVLVYNRLVMFRNRVENSSAQINVQLKKRTDLVPKLVSVVKGYAKHEKTVFLEVTRARTAIISAGSIEKKLSANSNLTSSLKTLFAVAEKYPELRANENFLELQKEISDVESKIAYTRQFYNDTVLRYNNIVQMFPSKIIASLLHFKPRKSFEITSSDTESPEAEF